MNQEQPLLELVLPPSGRLFLDCPGTTPGRDPWTRKVIAGFEACPEAGLLALAATKPSTTPSPSLAFWRDFACQYLSILCRTPECIHETREAIPAPAQSELATIILSAPPMRGGEYLNADVLRELWRTLDTWLRDTISKSGHGQGAWLKANAPAWHQIGRVCFHLAENKNDPEYPFAFLATYAPRMSKSGKVQYQPLGNALQEYAGRNNDKALVNLLSPVHLASRKSEFVKELVMSNDLFHPLAWSPQEAYRFLQDIPVLEEAGLLVRIPDWWRKRPRPRVAVTIGEKHKGRFGADAMLDFKLSLALGDQPLTQEEWQRIMSADNGLLYIKGQWVEVDRDRLADALAHWQNIEAKADEEGLSFIEGMRLLAGAPMDLDPTQAGHEEERQWSFVNAGKWLSEILANLRDPDSVTNKVTSRNFHGTLRGYQKTGHKWLWFLTRLGLGACLADDMGLGKTIQILSLLVALREEKKSPLRPSLLVLPASLIANWKAEIEKFTPSLRTCFVHPSETSRADLQALGEEPDKHLQEVDLVITTYAMLLRQQWLPEVKWRLIILDEAQAIKNPSSRQTRVVKKLQADSRIALTGTPLENRISDLWSLFDFLCPGLLGPATRFKQFIKELDQREHDRYAPLRNLVSPYILRRMKTDKHIIRDLPDKTEVKTFCNLAKTQAAVYSQAVRDLAQALDNSTGIKRRGLVLSFLMRFKQICNHPSQLLGDGGYEPERSGKFERLRVVAEEIASRQDKALVFTQFREMTDPLAAFLAEIFRQPGLILHGNTPVRKRKALIDAFQAENGPPFFVLSLKAGGTGLNLTAASHVIHFDRWWNPAVENQATDRAFRIGQHRNVVVHKFICRGTVEEKIDELIDEKTSLATDIIKGGGENLLTEMNDQELLDIVKLDIDRALG